MLKNGDWGAEQIKSRSLQILAKPAYICSPASAKRLKG